MSLRSVGVAEADTLLAQGVTYLDVRSVPEFEAGHAPGAYNIPFSEPDFDELKPNPHFLAVVTRTFSKDTPLLIGCHSGNRSRDAGTLLQASGYTVLWNLRPGWFGRRNHFGSLEPGWSKSGKPIETGSPEGRSYAALRGQLDD